MENIYSKNSTYFLIIFNQAHRQKNIGVNIINAGFLMGPGVETSVRGLTNGQKNFLIKFVNDTSSWWLKKEGNSTQGSRFECHCPLNE